MRKSKKERFIALAAQVKEAANANAQINSTAVLNELFELMLANERIIDLPALVSQATNDLYETSANGTGSFKETRAQQNTYWNANIQLPSTSKVTGLVQGSWIPTFSGLVGITPPITVNSSRFIRQGNALIIAQDLQFTVTTAAIEFITDLPNVVTNPFTTFFQSIIMGQILRASAPTAMDGDVLNATSLAGSSDLVIDCNATNGTGLIRICYSAIVDIL